MRIKVTLSKNVNKKLRNSEIRIKKFSFTSPTKKIQRQFTDNKVVIFYVIIIKC